MTDKNVLKNERGQMAIFIALFFQVIFVFFAMAINVGLVVHDKINLQNAVDIAAYYGAMKQGEVLNQIAHVNYQMRQNYKLFVWRYRVLGTMGNINHPLMYGNTAYYASRSLPPEIENWNPNTGQGPIMPSVCVSHSVFQETVDLDNEAASVCRENSLAIPAVPQVSAAFGTVPGSGNLGNIFSFLADQIASFCMESGIMNFAWSARILAHFRVDGRVRKNIIYNLASNLSGPEPLDLRNEPISEGVRKTFELNLTDSNRNGIQDYQYFNSLSTGGCENPRTWMVDIKINPVIFFNDWAAEPSSGRCPAATPIPNRQRSPTSLATYNGRDNFPYGFQQSRFGGWITATQGLQEHWQEEPNDDLLHSSVGFEKNPWCMVYTGVSATTVVRKPFDPTSSGFTLVARGFAKPFGGRIGPWYGKSWPRGTPNSQASNTNDMVDPLLPSRDVAGAAPAANARLDVANYSRYPGDPLGMNSFRTLGAMIAQISAAFNHNSRSDTPAIAVANYDLLGGLPNLLATGDSLPRRGQTESRWVEPIQRRFELAAMAPDIFDAFYYSVEPTYYANYFVANGNGGQIAPNDQLFDFGSTKDGAQALPDFRTTSRQFSIVNQIENARNGRTYMPDYEPIIRNWNHLLTSWHQRGVVDFTMDQTRFGACNTPVGNPSYPTPGNCLQGGRTGYSVKSISHDFLMSGDHELGGGPSGASGAILNQPPF